MSGWIKHDRSSRPNLPPGTIVQVRLECGWSEEDHVKSKNWEWWDEPLDEDSSWMSKSPWGIVAYRIVDK